MANTDAAFGLKPVAYLSGAPYNGAANLYYIPSTDGTAVYRGSTVKLAGSADADGIPTVTAATAASDKIVGVVVAFDAVKGVSTINLDITYRPASTAQYVWVADDPNLVFEVQEDSVGGALAATDVGGNIDFIGWGNGSTTHGNSTMEIDSSSVDTTNTRDAVIVRLAPRADNAIGNYAKWWVRLNDHQYINQATGV